MLKRNGYLILVLLIGLFLVSCAAHQPPAVPGSTGFWMGLWHGICAPIAFIISLFKDIRIYAFPNGGGWYDLGFLIGISIWGGGGASAACRKRD
jgi:hypothetical protein